jgi:chromosome segregation ATPase
MIPSEAQHAERTRLKHEIATDLHLRIQAETQDQFRTLQQTMEDKLLNFNDTQHLFDPTFDQKVRDTQRLQEQHQLELEAVALRLALTEVEHTKLADRTEYLEAMATRLAKHKHEDRLSHLETALSNQDTIGGSVPNIEHQLASLDSRTREQDKAIAILEAQARAHDTARARAQETDEKSRQHITTLEAQVTQQNQAIEALQKSVSSSEQALAELQTRMTPSHTPDSQHPNITTPDNAPHPQQARSGHPSRHDSEEEEYNEDKPPSNPVVLCQSTYVRRTTVLVCSP